MFGPGIYGLRTIMRGENRGVVAEHTEPGTLRSWDSMNLGHIGASPRVVEVVVVLESCWLVTSRNSALPVYLTGAD